VQPTEPRVHEHDVFGATAAEDLDPPGRITFEPRFAVDHQTLFGRHGSTLLCLALTGYKIANINAARKTNGG
jgi:hypothetical protein